VSGIHDLERILGTVDHFRVPGLVLINKADLNPTQSTRIEAFCHARGIEVVGKLPYDEVVTRAMVQGQAVTRYQPDGEMAHALRRVWARLRLHLDGAG
jgi:MinD superfamily P-loop ATPase